jgi:hypothetical protein
VWLDPNATKGGTMQFLAMIRSNENSDFVPSEQIQSDMASLMQELTQAGVLISTARLRPTAEGARLRLHKGQVSTMDGPFTETKEVVGGFGIVEVDSKEEAIALAKRFLQAHGDAMDFEVELRQLDESERGA